MADNIEDIEELDEEAQQLHMSFDNHVTEVYHGTISLRKLLGPTGR